jgi:hypothetical protein
MISWTYAAKALGRLGAIGLAVLALAALMAPAAFAAESERVLDPELSLTGGCTVEALDPVADPGCPYAAYPDGPSAAFADPRAVTTDDYGNVFVSSFGKKLDGSEGRIDIFGPDGSFISELQTKGPTSMAVDSQGYLYVAARQAEDNLPILRFAPCAPYEPDAGVVEYCNPPVTLTLAAGKLSLYTGLAINRDNDHLFADFGSGGVREISSAAEGNSEIRTTFAGQSPGGSGMAVDSVRDLMYASGGTAEERIDIFDLNTVVGESPGEYEKIGSIEDADVPGGDLGFRYSIAVDEGNGHVFVLDGGNCNLYEFDQSGGYVQTIDFPLQCSKWAGEIGVDNGASSPNGALSPKGRYLYSPSHEQGTGHSFAFFESSVGPPEVKSFSSAHVTEDEAELRAQINPRNLETTYAFELKAVGAGAWSPVGQGTVPGGNLDAEATAVAVDLTPGTSYLFRVVATNEEGSDEAEASFATYPRLPAEPTSCPNALRRTGPSALLPDCRAYELVTPADTNGHPPLGTRNAGDNFTNRQVSPAGDKLPFRVEGGSLPGLGGTGSLFGDPYLATRTADGWSTDYIGPSPTQATAVAAGTSSPDQGYSFWVAEGSGSAVLGGITHNVRYPDGHSEPLGQGSIGFDPEATGKLISEGGGHIIFVTGAGASSTTAVQLEPEAAPNGTQAVYDRTADGTLHVISLGPGNTPFVADEHAGYEGASLDGVGVAFEVADKLYLRYDNQETYEIGQGVDFAGVAEGGRRVFYVQDGDLKAFDVEEGVIEFSESGDVVPVQVSADGTAAYFVSPSVLTPGEANPEGDEAQSGAENLYLSREGALTYVATVTDRDVEGSVDSGSEHLDGLGLWVDSVGPNPSGRLGNVPARATPDGSVLLFTSRAALAGYDPEGHAEVYRYDSGGAKLQCLSCNPTGATAASEATLQSRTREGELLLFSAQAWLESLRADGRRAFFQSSEALVARDSDGLQDVYQWEDQGVGSCDRPDGCVQLISSPHSLRNEYLWAVSRSGDDVFFLSSERLVGADADETPSVYDARVGGGFAEEEPPICEGEGCRPQLSPPPSLPGALSPVLGSGDNVGAPRRCGKGKRKVKRAGKVRCVKKHKHSSRHRRAGADQKGGRR